MGKLRRLGWRDRWLLIQSLAAVTAVRAALWVTPFRAVRRLVTGLGTPPPARPNLDEQAVERVAWAVQTASARVPGATCLTQALAGLLLLRSRGLPGSVHIGVTRDLQNRFAAHAWLECHGEVVLGDSTSPRTFTPLLVMEGRPR